MKKNITDYDIKNKRVIIRVDFNVPISNSTIEDDNRIKAALPTIKYAIDNGAKVILMSHLGRVKTSDDLAKNDLRLVSIRLSELLFKPVKFISTTRGSEVEEAISNMKEQDVILLQNTRYEDLEGKESSCDEELSKYWASLGDIFINDAFATIHRAHASNVGIAKYLPNGIGFLVEKELSILNGVNEALKPLAIILGGAKVSDKIGLINNLIDKVDYIIVGGGMAYTFLKGQGYNIGNSILDSDSIEYTKELLTKYPNKIILPIDSIVSKSTNPNDASRVSKIDDILDDEIGLDIGPDTISLFKERLKDVKSVIWNGPMGLFEVNKYSVGTKELMSYIVSKDVIICGGDTASAAINLGFKNDFKISTGGGASLEMLAGNALPGLEVINEK